MHWTANPQIHLAFEVLGFLAGAAVYVFQRKTRRDPLPAAIRARVFTGAALGAAVGARILFWLCDPALTLQHWSDPAYLLGGKTVVGGLLGGLIGVEWIKKIDGVRRSTGDAFVYPLIVAIAIGRIGCFLYGPADHTAGNPTSLPWGIAIGDGIRRHPVALYEIAFLIVIAIACGAGFQPASQGAQAGSLRHTEGNRFRLFLSAYLAFRLLVDFIKPEPPPILLGMSAIPWACLAGLAYYALTVLNDNRGPAVPVLRRSRVDLHDVLPED